MHGVSPIERLKKNGYRDTQPRRTVVEALQKMKKPVSPYDVQKWLQKKGTKMNAVTIYRIVDVLEELGIVHKHPFSGLVSICTMPDVAGHHGFLLCRRCDRFQEFHSRELCHAENRVAQRAGYIPDKHVSEIVGICVDCQDF